MGQYLFYYQRPEPATWVYLSSFLIIGLYIMFHRLWSIRNLDIVLLILLAPGLMMVYEGRKKRSMESARPTGFQLKSYADGTGKSLKLSSPTIFPGDSTASTVGEPSLDLPVAFRFVSSQPSGNTGSQPPSEIDNANVSPGTQNADDPWPSARLQRWGFVWLLSVCALLLIRLLLDTTMVRRPLLEPNLSSGGLTFIGVSMFLFLMANVITSTAEEQSHQGPKSGPGYVLLNMLPDIATTPDVEAAALLNSLETGKRSPFTLANFARLSAIFSNLAIVAGMVLIGYFHFDNAKTGIGAATLFLLLPYTAQMTGRADHVLPGAFLVWAILAYRLPSLSGMLIGFAAGLVYYPFFLLPLWLSFYWQHGLKRFLGGFFISLALLTGTLFLGPDGFWQHLQQMYGAFTPAMSNLQGIWGLGWHPYFRIPVIVVFILLCLSFIFWPAQKNLGTLMSCSAAIMVGTQFCHGYGGGLYMAWFLPLVMLTVFRPNLDNRIALEVVRRTRRKRMAMRLSNVSPNPTLAASISLNFAEPALVASSWRVKAL